jgi:4-amino-4-deoxy-L-arabinose transferase-like glycosyltransferase
MASFTVDPAAPDEKGLSVSSSARPGGAVALLLILLAIPFLFWPTLAVPLERDEGEYAWAADVFECGGLPYRDTFMQKPPGIFLIYHVIFLAVGTNAAAIHAALVANYMAVAYLLYRLGWSVTGRREGGLWAALLLALSLIDPAYEAGAAGTEAFMILPLVGAMACLWAIANRGGGRWVAVAGLLFGLAIFFKQVAVFHGVHIGISLLILGRGWKQRLGWLLLFSVFAILPYGVCAIWYAARGALDPFLDCLLFHNLEYISGGLETHGWQRLVREIRQFGPFDLLLWAGAAASVAVTLWRRQWWLGWFLGGWLIAALAGIASGGYYRGHYFIQALPIVCLAASVGLSALYRFPQVPPLVALAVLALWAWPRPWSFGKAPDQQSIERYHVRRFVNAVAVGDWLRSAGNGSLFVMGSEPEIYHYSGMHGVSPYVIANPLFGGFPSSHGRQLKVLETLAREMPTYVVMAWPEETIPTFAGSDRFLIQQVRTLLKERYRPVGYARRDAVGMMVVTEENWDKLPVDLVVFARKP